MWADLEPTVRMLGMICVGLVVVMMLGAANVEADVCQWYSVWERGGCTSTFTPTGDYSGTQEVTCTGGYTLELVCYSGAGGSGGGGGATGGGGGTTAGDFDDLVPDECPTHDSPPDIAQEREQQNKDCSSNTVGCGGGLFASHWWGCCVGNTRWGVDCTTCDCGRCCIAEFAPDNPILSSLHEMCQAQCQMSFTGGDTRGSDDHQSCQEVWDV